MIQPTSINVYHEIIDEGLLQETQEKVYRSLYHYGPMTAREVLYKLVLTTNFSGRFSELRDLGVIQEGEKRKCKITGRTALTWSVTGNLPTTPEKQPGKPEAIEMLRSVMTNVFLSSDDYSHLKQIAEIIKGL